jgi:hypothetical protein
MESLTPLAKTSVVVSWLLVGLACLTTTAQLVWRRSREIKYPVADGCMCVALFVGTLLVVQTTWAIVDEGAGRHQSDMKQGSIAAVAKVVGSCITPYRFH